jgi:Type IV secretion system pilin
MMAAKFWSTADKAPRISSLNTAEPLIARRMIATAGILLSFTSFRYAWAQSIRCSGQPNFLYNPTCQAGIGNIQSFIAAFLKAVVEISLPILTLFIVYAGFKFVFARGKPDDLAEAKRNFLYVILGAILILGAWVLASLIGATATQVVGSP